ncbi:MAG: FtsX-like permease family protein [Verrucomicrobia bacterium]|nr:FtsX-like permease family protein [Verrucomicrobiota bacterium]
MLFALAWRNLWRQRTRTVLSLASMAVASALLVFMASMQLGSYETMKTNMLRIVDGYAQIQSVAYPDDPDVANFVPDAHAVAARVAQVPGITAVAPRGMSFVILASGETSYGAAISGIDPAIEPKVSSLSSTISLGRYLQPDDEAAIIMGDALARNLGLEIGDRVTMLGSGADRSIAADSLELVGIFHSGFSQMDRQIAQMPLARFQDTFAMPGAANMLVIGGDKLTTVTRALPALAAAAGSDDLVARSWIDLQPALWQAIALDMVTSGIVYISLIAVVVFIILNTLFMSVLERTREFGVLLAVGMKSGLLGRLMWLELVMLAVLGCAIGILIGGAVAFYFQIYGIYFSGFEEMMAEFGIPSRIYPQISLFSILFGPGAIVLAVVIGGLVPYRRIRKLEPVTAMASA